MFSFLILGVVPALFWIWLFYIFNRYKRTSAKLLLLLFMGGLLCGLLALTLNHIVEKYTIFWSDAQETSSLFDFIPPLPLHSLGFWVMVGFNEELAKLVVILLIAYPSRDFQEPFDGVLYAAVVALGFATIENAFYVEQYGFSILLTRTLITLPTHIFMSAPMGFYVARSRFALHDNPTEQKIHLESIVLLLKGWGIAALLHAGYDSLLSLGFKEWAYAQLFIMGGVTLVLRSRCLQLSQLAPPSVNYSNR
ncbi:MAG: PrsW family intramembrane metalloprotease [SAR324 cluster bacterium]|nr:PrsW family intramembrane metalloprotease [SAR324 cluster bacterium]